ncbi:hypothetical protein C2G38_2209993 [Gigaspora rosea]|uniref:Uncharacterized protein n=1 Tax=Gigaspora rosea TaxID=44941 RepID=A0A397UFD9_9GLOM|nr:hypothetical protein C2G38_2209993 [Gigaspora rosea]
MPKHKEYTISLLSQGTWDKSLHFRPFCHNWWFPQPIDKANKIIPLYPIRLFFKTLVILNERPEVLGFDKAIITSELLSNLPFRPYNFQIENLQIWIISIGRSNEITTNLAGSEFKSAFIYQFNKKQPNYIVELRSALQLIYPTEYEIDDREFQAWKAMLKYIGCSDVTPYEKNQSKFEFCSRSTTSNSDKSSLSILYNLGFVIPTPSYSTNTFWSSFHKFLNINKYGIDGRR